MSRHINKTFSFFNTPYQNHCLYDKEETVGEGTSILFHLRKFDLIFEFFGQSRAVRLYQPLKSISLSGTSYILSRL